MPDKHSNDVIDMDAVLNVNNDLLRSRVFKKKLRRRAKAERYRAVQMTSPLHGYPDITPAEAISRAYRTRNLVELSKVKNRKLLRKKGLLNRQEKYFGDGDVLDMDSMLGERNDLLRSKRLGKYLRKRKSHLSRNVSKQSYGSLAERVANIREMEQIKGLQRMQKSAAWRKERKGKYLLGRLKPYYRKRALGL